MALEPDAGQAVPRQRSHYAPAIQVAPSNHPEITEAPSPRAVSRHRILAQTRLDFWLDGALLAAFVLAYSIGFTGLAVHE